MTAARDEGTIRSPAKDEAERREDEALEEGLEESFPASDPPANVQPGHDRPAPSSGHREKDGAKDRSRDAAVQH